MRTNGPRAIERLSIIYPYVAFALATYLMLIGFERFATFSTTYPWDAHIDWGAARVILAGRNPYTPAGLKELNLPPNTPLGHPPTIFVWFFPLAKLSVEHMKVVWNQLTIFWLMLHMLLMTRELRLPSLFASASLLFGAVVSASWMGDHINVVQLSELIAFLYVLAWIYLRRGADIMAGVMLGLACTLKFYPGVVVVYLLLCKRWRVALAAGATWLSFAAFITPKVGGLWGWKAFFAQTEPYTHYYLSIINNASIQAIVQRLYWKTCVYQPIQHDVWKTGSMLASVISVTLFLLVLAVSRKRVVDGKSIDIPFALFTLVSLITGPYMWEHYNVTLVFPLLIAALALVRARFRGTKLGWVIAGFALIGLAIFALSWNMRDKWETWLAYAHDPSLHLRLHLLEIGAWIPTPLLLIVLIPLVLSPHTRDDLFFQSSPELGVR